MNLHGLLFIVASLASLSYVLLLLFLYSILLLDHGEEAYLTEVIVKLMSFGTRYRCTSAVICEVARCLIAEETLVVGHVVCQTCPTEAMTTWLEFGLSPLGVIKVVEADTALFRLG